MPTAERLKTSRKYLIYSPFSERLVDKASPPWTDISDEIRNVRQ